MCRGGGINIINFKKRQHPTHLCIGDFLGALISIIISAGAIVKEDFLLEGRVRVVWLGNPLPVPGVPGPAGPLPVLGVLTLPPPAPPACCDKLKPFMSLLSF